MDYLAEVKAVCDSLAAVEPSISNREQVQHILCTLGSKYVMFCTALQVPPFLPSFEDLKAKLLQHETQHVKTVVGSTHTILYSGQPVGTQREIPAHMSFSGATRGRMDVMHRLDRPSKLQISLDTTTELVIFFFLKLQKHMYSKLIFFFRCCYKQHLLCFFFTFSGDKALPDESTLHKYPIISQLYAI